MSIEKPDRYTLPLIHECWVAGQCTAGTIKGYALWQMPKVPALYLLTLYATTSIGTRLGERHLSGLAQLLFKLQEIAAHR